MDENENNIDGAILWANNTPIMRITSNITDEGEATLWAIREGLEIIDGGNDNV